MQSSSSYKAVIRQSLGSCQAVVRQSTGRCQIFKKFVIYCAVYGAEKLFSLVFFQIRLTKSRCNLNVLNVTVA